MVSSRVLNDLFSSKLVASEARATERVFKSERHKIAWLRRQLRDVSFARRIVPPPIGRRTKLAEWKDTTSYSQSEPANKRVPREWTHQTKHIRVVIHHLHGYDPEVWFMSCHELDRERVELKCRDVTKAQMEALGLIRVRLLSMLHDVEEELIRR